MKQSQEMYAHVEQWLSSGKTKKEYIKNLDISSDSFSYWVKKYHRESGKTPVTVNASSKDTTKAYSFIEVPGESGVLTKSKTPQAEIKLPSGVHIILY